MSSLRGTGSSHSCTNFIRNDKTVSYLSSESVQRCWVPSRCYGFSIPRKDRDRLVDLTTYGMIVSETPRFRPCPSPPVFPRSYLEVSTTVDKLLYKQWLLGLILIIPTVMAVQIPGIHFGHPSWAVKSGYHKVELVTTSRTARCPSTS